MRKCNIKKIPVILFFIIAFFLSACAQNLGREVRDKTVSQVSTDKKDSEKKYKVTFIELGSVKCIPCQQMQLVMKSIETKYGNEVKI